MPFFLQKNKNKYNFYRFANSMITVELPEGIDFVGTTAATIITDQPHNTITYTLSGSTGVDPFGDVGTVSSGGYITGRTDTSFIKVH